MAPAVRPNERASPPNIPSDVETRAHAQASWMLMDSLLMVLVEHRLVPVEKLIDAIDVVITTKQGYLEAESEDASTVKTAIGMLIEVSNSLRASPGS
jgi:hypothetical protein